MFGLINVTCDLAMDWDVQIVDAIQGLQMSRVRDDRGQHAESLSAKKNGLGR